jgi:hypothetical protein
LTDTPLSPAEIHGEESLLAKAHQLLSMMESSEVYFVVRLKEKKLNTQEDESLGKLVA